MESTASRSSGAHRIDMHHQPGNPHKPLFGSAENLERETGFEGEGTGTPRQPVCAILELCATGDAVGCHDAADSCNGSLQVVALADPVAEALDRARTTWISGHDGRRLRRDLLRLLAELED